MSMTREEKVAKNYIRRVLSSNGYPTYSKIFEQFYKELEYEDDLR